MTNFERITATPEAFVEAALDDDNIGCCEFCICNSPGMCIDETDCRIAMLMWLNQPTKEMTCA